MLTTQPLIADLAKSGPNNQAGLADAKISIPATMLPILNLIGPHRQFFSNTSFSSSESSLSTDRRNFTATTEALLVTLGPGFYRVRILHAMIPTGSSFITAGSRVKLRKQPGAFAIDLSELNCSGANIQFPYELAILVQNSETYSFSHEIYGGNAGATHTAKVTIDVERLL